MSKLIIPYRILPSFIQSHPELTFIYSTDSRYKGGMGNQWFIAGFKNSFPVPTLIKFCSNKTFFDDIFLIQNKEIIDEAIRLIPKYNPIIVPENLGRGCARMPEVCPKTYKYLWSELNKIKTPYTIDYNVY